MLYTHISGIKRNNRQLMRKAIKFMVSYVVGDRIQVGITVKFNNYRETDACAGLCGWTDDFVRPREFEICIDNKQSLREQLRTLAHEIVHVRQFAKGELYDYQRDFSKTRWRDTVVTDRTKYKNLPWEREAYKLQTGILKEFLKQNDIDLRSYRK